MCSETPKHNMHEIFFFEGTKKVEVVGDSHPSLPKSSKYLVSRCLEPLKAFSGGVWGSKHLLTRYLED